MFGITLAGVGTLFFSAMSILTKPDPQQYTKAEVEIAMRQIGHALLLQAGDSTSRVMPVKQVDEAIFQVAFQSPFTFVPDSLVKMAGISLAGSKINLPYILAVRDCQSNEVVYGFQMGLNRTTTLVPCLGREQVPGCYTIQLSFLKETPTPYKSYIAYLTAAFGLTLLIVGGRNMRLQEELPTPETLVGGVTIGSYQFLIDRRRLHHAVESIELSDKETKLLKIFADRINQPIPREQLMKEVWEDEGVIVGRSLDVFVSKLRKKLRHDPTVQLINIHGVGYSLEVS